MGKPKKLPSGNYRIRIYLGEDGGKQIMKSITAPTARECRILAAEYEAAHKKPTSETVGGVLRAFYESGRETLAPPALCAVTRPI